MKSSSNSRLASTSREPSFPRSPGAIFSDSEGMNFNKVAQTALLTAINTECVQCQHRPAPFLSIVEARLLRRDFEARTIKHRKEPPLHTFIAVFNFVSLKWKSGKIFYKYCTWTKGPTLKSDNWTNKVQTSR